MYGRSKVLPRRNVQTMIYAQDRRPQSAKKVQQILKSADLAIAKQAISDTPIVCEQTGGEELLRIQ